MDQRSVAWFLGITFLFSWMFFVMRLFFNDIIGLTNLLPVPGFWAIAMWGPGIAAIITTVFVEKKTFKSLRLNTLGPKRYYLWAWLLPPALMILASLFTLIFGIARLDLSLIMIRAAMASAAGGNTIPAEVMAAFQILLAIGRVPFINVVLALGEELGWRGYLLPKLLPLGQWKAILISGIIWGVWHTPAVVQGLNYPGHPIAGTFMMTVLCVLLSAIFSWLYLNTKSPWVAAVAHASVNAAAGLPLLFLHAGFNTTLGGTIGAPTAWLAMILFIIWLLWTKRFPVQGPPHETATSLESKKEAQI
jgi:membrane protease YdiL (CAAX protease family)